MTATVIAFVALAIASVGVTETLLRRWSQRRTPAPQTLIEKALRQRFIITLPRNEGVFTGVLVDHDQTYWIFDNCQNVPTHQGETADDWPGLFWVIHDCDPAPYLQQITPDAVGKFKAMGREFG